MKNKIQNKEKPQICAIDLNPEIIEALQAIGLHCFNGTLGPQVVVREYGDTSLYQCQPNCNFPENLHEYDIVIVDLQSQEPIEYRKFEHRSSFLKGSDHKILVSRYPETIFDPRPLSSSFLRDKLGDFFLKETLIIVFCSTNEVCTYYPMTLVNNRLYEEPPLQKFLYTFMKSLQINDIRNKKGKEIVVLERDRAYANFFHKYRRNFSYEVVFQHPTQWLKDERDWIPMNDFVPLLLNSSNEIVGFIDSSLGPSRVLAFPQLHDSKKEFLLELIDELLPRLYPKIFPYSKQLFWLENYPLPNQADIRARKTQLEDEYKAALTQIEKDLQEDRAKYRFLHDLITETADTLVKAVEDFLTWLGFENIVRMDETNPKNKDKEEDIQINLGTGLLIIEIKGIRRTSTDNDCGQIGKIKNRRKERSSLDVFALYIVNHERHLPPIDRQNPPFNEQQIRDAQLAERGLLTTYGIFKLYSYIEKNFITKEDARSSLLKPGLVEFKPSRSILLGSSPLEVCHDRQIVILNISNITVNKNASIIVCNNEDWFRAEILEIQLYGKTVKSVSEGEISVKLSRRVPTTFELWLEDTR